MLQSDAKTEKASLEHIHIHEVGRLHEICMPDPEWAIG